MIVTEDIINQLLREIDVPYCEERLITPQQADDLSESVKWILGKSLNESNISYVIDTLRSYKKIMNQEAVSRITKSFRKICGSYM